VQITAIDLTASGLPPSPISEVSNEIYVLYKLLKTTKRHNTERGGARPQEAERNFAKPYYLNIINIEPNNKRSVVLSYRTCCHFEW
jgi:hypothetical protein